MKILDANILLLSIIFLLSIIIFFLATKIFKRKKWNNELYNENKMKYTLEFIKNCGLPEEVCKHIAYRMETISFLEKNKVINKTALIEYFTKNNYKTDTEVIEKKLNHLFISEKKEDFDLNNVIKTIYNKSLAYLEKIKTLEEVDFEKKEELFMESFVLFFIYIDLIGYLQNKEWAKDSNIIGLKYIIDNSIESKVYNGSQNTLEYDPVLLNIYKLIGENKKYFSNNLFLGYKFQ